MIKIEEIINISSYFSIIAHTPGRLRVRVNPKIVNEAQNISLDDITNLPKKISGIEDIKINLDIEDYKKRVIKSFFNDDTYLHYLHNKRIINPKKKG